MPPERPAIAVTGANGFIGRNLVTRLRELGHAPVALVRETPPNEAAHALGASDIVFHLAGANRPEDPDEYRRSNLELTIWLAKAVAAGGRKPLVVFSSSTKAGDGSPFGVSKQAAEQALLALASDGGAKVALYRLPGIFGKWSRPNYNSVVATFCHNLARGLPIRIDDPEAAIELLYVDDLIDQWLALIDAPAVSSSPTPLTGIERTTVGEIAEAITTFASGRTGGRIEPVGTGLKRALYAVYVAALPEEAFAYPLVTHEDPRGRFTEIIKAAPTGQISCLTAAPGVTRGGHYHHSKVEKFLVVHGEALFRYRDILSGQRYELRTSAARPIVVETIPGWTHDVTNVGESEMVCLVWANEVFDPARPDTTPLPP